MQNSARWVLPVRSVSRCRRALSTSQGRGSRSPRRPLAPGEAADLLERDLHLVDRLGPALVEARGLAGRADEPAGEEVGQRRVALPVGDQADQQVGPSQQRSVDRLPAAEGQVVAAAGAGVQAVEVELLGRQLGQPRFVVQRRHQVALLCPGRRGLHVDLDDAGVGSHRQRGQRRVGRRRVALEHHRATGVARRDLDQVEQVGVVLEPRGRREEHEDLAVALLERQRGAVRTLGVGQGHHGQRGVDRLRRFEVRRLRGRLRVDPRDRVERQPETDRARAGREDQPSSPELPGGAGPALLAGGERKYPAGRRHDVGVELGDQGERRVVAALGRIAFGQPHVVGQCRERVLVGRDQLFLRESEELGDPAAESLGVDRRRWSRCEARQRRASNHRIVAAG